MKRFVYCVAGNKAVSEKTTSQNTLSYPYNTYEVDGWF